VAQRPKLSTLTTSQERGYVAGLFYLAGAVIVLLAAMDPAVARVRLLAIAAVVGGIGLASLLLANRFRPVWTHTLLLAASTLTALGVVSGGGELGPMIIVAIYMLIAMHSALLVSPIAIVAHLGWALTSMVISTSLMWPASTVVGMVGVFVAAGGTITLVTCTLVERLRQEATTDPLTGLANRATFDRALAQAQATVLRTGEPLSLLLIDLDDFKAINDQYGHAAGDAVLQQSAAAWWELLRGRDTLARLGGDEFAVVLPGAGLDAACQTADRLQQATTQSVGCSVGVSQWQPGQSADEVLAGADASLYQSKADKHERRTLRDAAASR
jgi:diguanylate cyclase (GGDEF)-like protein